MKDSNIRVFKGVKRYWRRRGYRRLATASTDHELRSKRRKWSWKLRMPRRLKIKLRFKFNPKKLIARVHDAYVRMMMRVANMPAVNCGAIAGYGGGGIGEFGMRPMKEYDEKMIIQMYNSLVMRQADQRLKALEVEPQCIADTQYVKKKYIGMDSIGEDRDEVPVAVAIKLPNF